MVLAFKLYLTTLSVAQTITIFISFHIFSVSWVLTQKTDPVQHGICGSQPNVTTSAGADFYINIIPATRIRTIT
jgi:hypothetical protein